VPMLVVVTDSDAMPAFERALLKHGDHGFTVLPTVWGRGRSGLHAGDRVHPGGSSLLFVVLPEKDLPAAAALLRAVRDGAGVGESTKMFSVPAVELP
jgi:hypothetical protein